MIISELFEGPQLCPECGGISFSDLILAEKKDACYHKVKASAKVWPSAYASGRLVQCRKKGAANYGNKSEGVAEGWKDVVAGGALALGALGAGAQTMPNINAQQVELTNKYYNALVQRAKEDGRELDRRTLNFLKAKAEDAAALKLQQASPKKQQGFPAQGSERRVSRNIDNFESQGVAEGSLNEFAPDGFNGDDDEGFSPEIAKMAQEHGFTKGVSLADGATLETAIKINHWHTQHGGMYKQYFAKGFKAGRMNKVNHDNKQYNLNLKLMKDGSIRHGEQGVAEEEPIKVTADVAANWPMAETRRGQIPMTLNPGESDNLEPENIAGFRQLPAYKQGQAAQQKAGKQLIQKSPYTFQSDQDWAYRQGAFDAQQAAMFANFGKSKPLTIEGGEQQKGADYRDPKEVDYDDEYDAMVARVKKLAGLGPMKTVYDPNKRVYRNMPTAQQPKK